MRWTKKWTLKTDQFSMSIVFVLFFLPPSSAAAQTFTKRGFLENTGTVYPQEAPNDAGRAVGESLFRYEGFYAVSHALQLAGAIDLRTDTHRQVERELHFSWWDREAQRPSAAVRRFS